jgi:hypothetical protein
VDETYVKVKGKWKYLYRQVDSTVNTIDFMLSENVIEKLQRDSLRKLAGTYIPVDLGKLYNFELF